MSGTLFPSEYPFDFRVPHQNLGYFFLKYFVSQNSFFALAQRPIYINYEVLVNAFNQNVIDFSHADIHELQSTKMSEKELEKLLELNNNYSLDRFYLRSYQHE